jgi:hypothetical protein
MCAAAAYPRCDFARRLDMPVENMIVLGIVVAGMVAFSVVAFWLSAESGRRNRNEHHGTPAE